MEMYLENFNKLVRTTEAELDKKLRIVNELEADIVRSTPDTLRELMVKNGSPRETGWPQETMTRCKELITALEELNGVLNNYALLDLAKLELPDSLVQMIKNYEEPKESEES
jgi:hypothetical protein